MVSSIKLLDTPRTIELLSCKCLLIILRILWRLLTDFCFFIDDRFILADRLKKNCGCKEAFRTLLY